MAHICNYFCQGPVHAINLLMRLRAPYETLSPERQAAFLEDLLRDLRTLEKGAIGPWRPQAIERLLPVQELSSLEFYQQNEGWSTPNIPVALIEDCDAYVALVRYGTKEVPDAVSGF